MTNPNSITRRDWLAGAAATATSAALLRQAAAAAPVKRKAVAAVITAYEKGLHADVLIGKILEGWQQDGGAGPALTLASMYVEQFTDKDLARGLAKKYGVPIFPTIVGAVGVGSREVPVDGVLIIGEHGRYAANAKGQALYPRRRLFEGVVHAFRVLGRRVPVFSDKHLSYEWAFARWMVEHGRLSG